jgi:hypothetical protein
MIPFVTVIVATTLILTFYIKNAVTEAWRIPCTPRRRHSLLDSLL